MRWVKHPLPNSKPMLPKCICPGGNVPFYCPVHGRVENPNWPLLKPLPSRQGGQVMNLDARAGEGVTGIWPPCVENHIQPRPDSARYF
jgi:hypothetical protein